MIVSLFKSVYNLHKIKDNYRIVYSIQCTSNKQTVFLVEFCSSPGH